MVPSCLHHVANGGGGLLYAAIGDGEVQVGRVAVIGKVDEADGGTALEHEPSIVVWSGVVAFISYKLVDLVIGMRVTEDQEREGLDIASHGESAYHE